MLEPNVNAFIETFDAEEEEDSSYCDEDQASEEIPQSLLSYFEISQSRAAVSQQLILNELQASHHTEGQTMNNHIKDLHKLDEQNKNEEILNDDTFFNKDPNTEDDDALMKSLKGKYIHVLVNWKNNKEAEQRKQREMDFQEDLQKIMAAEKHNQVELELNKSRDHEKLEQELQLQQEHISNLQKQVEDMKRMFEVGQRRQQEEDKRKMVEREERKRRKEEEKRRQERRLMEEEEEERRNMMERKLREEEKKKEEEEEMSKTEEEEKRKREEENRLREEMTREELKRKKDEELKEEKRKRLAEEIKRTKKESKENEERVKSVKEDYHGVVVNYRQIKKHNKEEKHLQETDVKQREDEKRNKTEEEQERIIKDKCMVKVTGSVKEMTQSDSTTKLKNSEEEKQKMNDEDENGGEEVITDQLKIAKNHGKMEKVEEKMMRKEKKNKNEVKRVGDSDRTKKNVLGRTEEMQAGERWVEQEGKMERKEKNSQEKNATERMEELRSCRILDSGEQKRHSEEESIQTDTNTKERESREGLKITAFDSLNRISSSNKTMVSPSFSHPLKPNQEKLISPTSGDQSHLESTDSLPDHTEQKRLLWMKECNPWSKMSLQNRRKQQGGSARSGTERTRRRVKASSLPPLSPNTLLNCTGCTSLEQITTVTLEDLDGCSLSTVAQCPLLRSLTLRRCGLRALEGISKLQKLLYVDVQENEISYVGCEDMTCLRVLRLSRNKLTSIHGLRGADNLDFLDLSHNSIIRIAGLESMRSLQRLLVDHNQLISTKGLRDVSSLLHLDLSHNHLAAVEGLETSALLHSLDLRANSLTEIPILNNQVLLRELRLDDNNISSLQGLAACWLPLMHHLSVAQNRITELPSMWDFVSLQNLDLRFNLLTELKDVCRNLEGCDFLRVIHLAGNPLQQESDWRSTLQTAVSGLEAIDGQQTDSFLSPAGQQGNSSPGFFQTFCQAQLKQTRDLEERHSGKLNIASPSYRTIKDLCLHFNLTLKLAEVQRFAHEYGDTSVSNRWEADLTAQENTSNCRNDENRICDLNETTSSDEIHDNIGCNTTIFKEVPLHVFTVSGRTSSSSPQRTTVDLKSTAAAVIQQRWRKYKEKCRNVNALVIVKKDGETGECGGKPQLDKHALNQDSAACVIQAVWRGFALRRRLTSALAAVTCVDAGDDDILEEVDLDEFVFDEEFLMFSEDFLHDFAESEQLTYLQPTTPYLDLYQFKPAPSSPQPTSKQAWVAPHDSATPDRTESSSTSVPDGLSNRTESVQEEWGLSDSNAAPLMLKGAQNMESKKQLPKKHQGQPVSLALVRNSYYRLGTSETRQRPAPRKRSFVRVGEAKLGLQQVHGTEQTKQESTQRWIHTRAARSDKLPESEHFLPDIHSPILNGGKVQLASQADPTCADRQPHSSGFWALSSLPAQLGQVNNYPRGNSMHRTSIGGLKCSSDRERPRPSPHSESPSATLQNLLPDVPDDPPLRARRTSQTCLRRTTF